MINDRALEASARAKLIADRDVIEFLNTDGLLGKISVEDKAIPIFTFEADDERKTILYLYRRELNDERIQICLKATVYWEEHEIISTLSSKLRRRRNDSVLSFSRKVHG